VRRQIAAYETAGELMPRELSPEDVIDEVVLRAYREFVREPEWRRTATWLERLRGARVSPTVDTRQPCSSYVLL
jgi:hypothetical protein